MRLHPRQPAVTQAARIADREVGQARRRAAGDVHRDALLLALGHRLEPVLAEQIPAAGKQNAVEGALRGAAKHAQQRQRVTEVVVRPPGRRPRPSNDIG